MARYHVCGETAATAATANHAILNIWNPSSTKRLKVHEIHLFKVTAGAADRAVIRRTTTQGTAGSTLTPVAANETEQIAAPPTSFTVGLAAFSAQPTIVALPGMYQAIVGAAIAAGMVWIFQDPIEIQAGNGLAVTTGTALAFPASSVTIVVED